MQGLGGGGDLWLENKQTESKKNKDTTLCRTEKLLSVG